MAHKRTTGSKAASAAGKVLANPKSTKAQKSAAASALSQKSGKKRGDCHTPNYRERDRSHGSCSLDPHRSR